jgi:benzoyl-CoA reductase/2-hydroxyglutaryl-CoA dehydratase subunit BcrC/BadD/HgdB
LEEPDVTEKELVGITTTLPIEVIFAAGFQPIDLNNRFVGSENRDKYIALAEERGFPSTTCAWVKGIYGAVHDAGIRTVVGVVSGDCSDNRCLCEVLADEGIRVVPFAYPYDRDAKALGTEIERLMEAFGTTPQMVEKWRRTLYPFRKLAGIVDELLWNEGLVTATEANMALLGATDFYPEPGFYRFFVEEIAAGTHRRTPRLDGLRLGLVGVPPMIDDLLPFLEQHGARVVYLETPRQFACTQPARDIVEQYHHFTYPYGIKARLEDISEQVEVRGIQGLIHYVQSFCHRAIEGIVLRRHLGVPVLTLEGEKPGRMDERTQTRLEAFLETLKS